MVGNTVLSAARVRLCERDPVPGGGGPGGGGGRGMPGSHLEAELDLVLTCVGAPTPPADIALLDAGGWISVAAAAEDSA